MLTKLVIEQDDDLELVVTTDANYINDLQSEVDFWQVGSIISFTTMFRKPYKGEIIDISVQVFRTTQNVGDTSHDSGPFDVVIYIKVKSI